MSHASSHIPFGLCVNGVSKTLSRRLILKNVSLFVQRGEAVGLLGPNGAGKTTCFSVITGTLFPDQGDVYLNKINVSRVPLYERAQMGIGYLPQDVSIFRGLTSEENILASLELVERDPDSRIEKLEAIIDRFSLNGVRKSQALTLSGGERRRVEIARLIALSPEYILLDEPFAGIDPIAVSEIKDLIFQLKTEKIGILITDHNVRETLGIVDRAYIIGNGKVIAEGSPDEIITNKIAREMYLGEQFRL